MDQQKENTNLEININCDITIDENLHEQYDYIYIVHNILNDKFQDVIDFENYV